MDGQTNEQTYEPPSIRVLGTVEELTQQLNKVGPQADALTQLDPNVVGSFQPL